MSLYFHRGALRRGGNTTIAIPPNTAMDAKRNRKVSGSLSRKMPPAAARTGTLSWTVAALAAVRLGNAPYQMTYPIPEASAPEKTA